MAQSQQTAPSAWIFQANPNLFDLVGAISRFSEMTWLARQHAESISVGDKVFLWQSGRSAGVVGVATVLAAVRRLPPDEDQSEFYLEPSKFVGLQPRVTIRITHVLSKPVLRSLLLTHPVLSMLTILRAAQGTNFPLTPKQSSALEGLVERDAAAGGSGTVRNPNWAREELILALDLYIRRRPGLPGKTSKEVAELSATLNRLAHALGLVAGDSRFRNPAAVYMKLMNFLALDPTYTGKGLTAGGALDAQVWEEFADKPDQLRRAADTIRKEIELSATLALTPPGDMASAAEFSEGRLAERLHRTRERDPRVAKTKKRQALKKHGRLFCEVCDFDFAAVYGVIGDGFMEAHHLVAVSDWPPGEKKTRLQDVALVCSNCHRMLHRTKPWPSVADLQRRVRPRGGLRPVLHPHPDLSYPRQSAD